MSIRGVIFDLDGTLADTLPDIATGANLGLRSFGLPELSLDEVRKLVGEGLPTLCKRALSPYPQVPVDEMVRRVMEYYRQHRLDRTTLFAGIPELLDTLTTRGIHLAVLTNKPQEHTDAILAAFFARWTFTAIEGYRQEGRRKPDPRTALDIVQLMNVQPAEVLMVGDSQTDVLTALNAGLAPVGVTWGYRPREEITAAGARHLIDKPADLLALL